MDVVALGSNGFASRARSFPTLIPIHRPSIHPSIAPKIRVFKNPKTVAPKVIFRTQVYHAQLICQHMIFHIGRVVQIITHQRNPDQVISRFSEQVSNRQCPSIPKVPSNDNKTWHFLSQVAAWRVLWRALIAPREISHPQPMTDPPHETSENSLQVSQSRASTQISAPG